MGAACNSGTSPICSASGHGAKVLELTLARWGLAVVRRRAVSMSARGLRRSGLQRGEQPPPEPRGDGDGDQRAAELAAGAMGNALG